MSNINSLFATSNTNTNVNARQLTGTAQLTALANDLAVDMINAMDAEVDTYRDRLQQSTKDMNILDSLITELVNIDDVDADFLLMVDEETVDGMLKSQQSKRSRCKSKAMTVDNYRSMVTAAIAELIIRKVCDKPKQHGGTRNAGPVDYTPAQLEAFEADQESLKREIRNIQSKKSIMKSKDGFDEADERWQALLKAEAMLKDLRIGGHTTVVEVDTTKDALVELMGEVSIDELKAADAKELLHTIMELINA